MNGGASCRRRSFTIDHVIIPFQIKWFDAYIFENSETIFLSDADILSGDGDGMQTYISGMGRN